MDVGSGWWVLGPIIMIAFWGGLFWLIARSLHRWPYRSSEDASISAKEIAARRFASGEIDETEYTQIINRLND